MSSISWQEYDHPHEEKPPEWYIVKWIIAVAGFLLCTMFNNVLLGILIIVATGTLSLLALRTTPTQTYTIDDTGVYIGSEYIPYDVLLSHGFLNQHGKTLLVLGTNTIMHQHVLIPTPDDIAPKAREILAMHAKNPEVENQEIPVAHTVMELIGL